MRWLSFIAVFIVAGCVATEQQRGYVFNAKSLEQIVVGESTRKDVIKLMGAPTTRSEFEVERWHYIGNKAEVTGILTPELKDQKVVSIEFTEDGIVKNIENKTLADKNDVEMVGRATPTEGHSVGVMQQLIGNFGRFNKQGTGADAAAQ